MFITSKNIDVRSIRTDHNLVSDHYAVLIDIKDGFKEEPTQSFKTNWLLFQNKLQKEYLQYDDNKSVNENVVVFSKLVSGKVEEATHVLQARKINRWNLNPTEKGLLKEKNLAAKLYKKNEKSSLQNHMENPERRKQENVGSEEGEELVETIT